MIDTSPMSPDVLPLATEQVVLRRLRVADLRDFQAYRTDPIVARFQGWSIVPDDEARGFLAEMQAFPLLSPGAWSQIGIAERISDRLIGDIGVHVAADGSVSELGISLARPFQRRGLAVEALRAVVALVSTHTPVSRVIARCDTRNTAARRLLARVGFALDRDEPVIVRGEACVDHVFVLSLAQPRGALSDGHRDG
jgi:RimJ/RimL family protein N-acetyltransferase